MKAQWKKALRLTACGVTGALTFTAMAAPALAASNDCYGNYANTQGTYAGIRIVSSQDCDNIYGSTNGSGTISAYSPSDLFNALQNGNADINGLLDYFCPDSSTPSVPENNTPAPEAPAPEAPAPTPSQPAPSNPVPSNPTPSNPDEGTGTQPDDDSYTEPDEGTTQPDAASALEKQMVDLVNAERAKAGLAPLTINAKLTEVARAKSQDMIDKGYFSHTSPTYGSPFDMMKTFGISYNTAGENIAMNMSMENAHQSLMNSDGHRKNILSSSFSSIGLGIVKDAKGYLYITQMFIG